MEIPSNPMGLPGLIYPLKAKGLYFNQHHRPRGRNQHKGTTSKSNVSREMRMDLLAEPLGAGERGYGMAKVGKNGDFMAFIWHSYGIHMAFIWHLYGMYMAFIWHL
jgi:hypothetical protein